ncbi:uncharacterized protein T551_00340 [Pneumocystis jirovecii RU7]|uniref:Transcription regulator Rua1 C-terminal domain-containing protein n=1 Tax=Pneumocystis jirovecii (strain RU7) TaxID=1408657 RepID=A0A0W4ZV61_PNEJ7|nr:uncharacterized protein T551_00340 [Pneumocystis jirovecii RU7]KTW32249.1 hypothetical protein T551_00340 [Pneumocystis jirovecii RU7]
MEAFVSDTYEINEKENLWFFPSLNGEEPEFVYNELLSHAHGHSTIPYIHPLSSLNDQPMVRSMQEIDNIIDYGVNPTNFFEVYMNPNGYKKSTFNEMIFEYNQKLLLSSLEKPENDFLHSPFSESEENMPLSGKKLNTFTAYDNKHVLETEKQVNSINDIDIFNSTTNINNLNDNFTSTWEESHDAMLSSQTLSNAYDQSQQHIHKRLPTINTNSSLYDQSQHQSPETLSTIDTNIDNTFSSYFPNLRVNTECAFDSNMMLKPSDFHMTSKEFQKNFCDLLNNHDLQNGWKPLFIESNTICPASLSSPTYPYEYRDNSNDPSIEIQNCLWKTANNLASVTPTTIPTSIPLSPQNICQDNSILASFIRSYNTLKTQYSMKQVHSILTIHRVIFKLNHYAQGLNWKHFLTACLQPLSNYTPPIALPWKPAYMHCLKGYQECWNWEWAPKNQNSKPKEENNEKKKLLFLPPDLPFGSKDVPLFLNSKKRINPSMLTKALENCPPEFKELITYKEEDFVMQCPAIYLRLSTEMKAPNLAPQLRNKGLKPIHTDDRFYYRSSLFDPIVPLDHYTISSELLVHSDPNERPYQNTKFEFIDRYNPEYYRYKGNKKQAHCSLCPPGGYDSGEDKNDPCLLGNWYVTKCSAFWYHKRYKHGIRKYGYPYPYPENVEVIKDKSIQAQCPMCHKWMKAGMVDDLVPRAFWTHYDQCWNMVEAILSPKKKKKEDDYCESSQAYGTTSKPLSHLNGYEKHIFKTKSDPKTLGKEKDDDDDDEIDEPFSLPTVLPPLELDDGDEYFPEEDEFSFVILKKTV